MAIIELGNASGAPVFRVPFHTFEYKLKNPEGIKDTVEKFWEKVNPTPSDCVLFGGGADIGTMLYQEASSYAPHFPSIRDLVEKTFYELCVKNKVPMIGICRGAQLITALSGGNLWHDVDNHNLNNHEIIINKESPLGQLLEHDTLITNSYHHQMCRLEKFNPEDVDLIAYSQVATTYKNGLVTVKGTSYLEPEIFYSNKIKALCIQGHPEWVGTSTLMPYLSACQLLAKATIFKQE